MTEKELKTCEYNMKTVALENLERWYKIIASKNDIIIEDLNESITDFHFILRGKFKFRNVFDRQTISKLIYEGEVNGYEVL